MSRLQSTKGSTLQYKAYVPPVPESRTGGDRNPKKRAGPARDRPEVAPMRSVSPMDLDVPLGERSRTSRGPCPRDHDPERVVRTGLPVVLDRHDELRCSRAHVSRSGEGDLVRTGLAEGLDRVGNEVD